MRLVAIALIVVGIAAAATTVLPKPRPTNIVRRRRFATAEGELFSRLMSEPS